MSTFHIERRLNVYRQGKGFTGINLFKPQDKDQMETRELLAFMGWTKAAELSDESEKDVATCVVRFYYICADN